MYIMYNHHLLFWEVKQMLVVHDLQNYHMFSIKTILIIKIIDIMNIVKT